MNNECSLIQSLKQKITMIDKSSSVFDNYLSLLNISVQLRISVTSLWILNKIDPVNGSREDFGNVLKRLQKNRQNVIR